MTDQENETPKGAPAKKPKAQSAKPAPKSQPAAKPEEPAQAAEPSQAAQATAAVGQTVSIVREKLVAGEQIVLTAALSIVIVVYLVFEFLLDYRVIANFTVLVAVLAILAIWIHRWGHYDFGKGYRIVVGALGLSLALFAVMNFLEWARAGGGAGEFLRLIGFIIYWISGIAAGYGAWLVFRTRED
jgi:hypothetical protein